MKYDIAVIGSGAGGLTAALLLALQGKRVAVIERAPRIAPLLRRFRRRDVWCDPGFHYTGGFQEDSFLPSLLRYMGMENHIRTLPMNPDCFDSITLDDAPPYRMPYGFDRLEAYLSSRFPSSRKAVRIYIGMLKRINRITALENCSRSFGLIPGEFNRHQSLQSFLLEAGAEQGLVDLLGSHGHILYGVEADDIPCVVHGYIMGSFYASTHAIVRGGDAFVDGFEERLRAAGVDVFTGEEAVSLLIDSSRQIAGIETAKGSRFPCDGCISTVHPQILARLLPETGIRPAFRNRLKTLKNTFAPFVVFYSVDKTPEPLSESNCFFIRRNDRAGGIMDPADTNSLVLMAVNPGAETEGRRSLTAILPCGGRVFDEYLEASGQASRKAYDQMRLTMSETVSSSVISHFPELDGHLEPVETATPVTYLRHTGTAEGSIYGVRQSIHQAPLAAATSIRNLYMAGQSVIPGVMGVMASAILAVTQIIEPGLFWSRFQKCL